MKATTVALLTLICICAAAVAQTVTVPVQHVAQLRDLTASEQQQISEYLNEPTRRAALIKAGNYQATYNALVTSP